MTRTKQSINADQVKLLISEGEGPIVEFKEWYTSRIDQDIVAFANAKGIKRMRSAMRDAGLRMPEFDTDGFFRAVFYRRTAGTSTTQDATQKTTQDATPTTAQKIIALITQNPEITRREMSEQVGITDSGVKYHLQKMQGKGLIRRAGPDKGGHWEVMR